MTDQTPATEAGRRLLQDVAPIKTQGLGAANDIEWKVRQAFTDSILAIEAEARIGYIDEDDCAASQRKSSEIAYEHGLAEGRADALREAADAVRALDAPKRHVNDANGNWFTTDMEYGWDAGTAAVLAILDPQP